MKERKAKKIRINLDTKASDLNSREQKVWNDRGREGGRGRERGGGGTLLEDSIEKLSKVVIFLYTKHGLQ
jgi:hypothetical protein